MREGVDNDSPGAPLQDRQPGEVGSVIVDAKERKPLQKLELVSVDGRRLKPEDIATKLGVPH